MPSPQIRFKEFKDPLKLTNLDIAVEIMQSGLSRLLSDADIGMPVIRSNNLKDSRLDCTDVKYWHSKDTQGSNLDNYILRDGDLLVNFINSMAQIGKVALYKNILQRDVIFTTNILRLRFKPHVVNRYIFNLFQTDKYRKFIESITKPAVNQASFTTKEFKKFEFCLPSIQEQTRIADLFENFDKKLFLLNKKLELLILYKKGVMKQIFNQEIRFKDENLQNFPEWKKIPLNEFANIVGGGTPDTFNNVYWGGSIQWFTPTELKRKYVSLSSRTITDLGLKNSSAKLLPKGAILFTSRATVGDVSIALNECATNQGFQSFVPRNSNSNEYLFYWLQNNKKLFLERASGSTFLEISKKEIEKILISKPAPDEQMKIANFLSSIDKKIDNVRSQYEKASLFKQGLLQQMFI